MELAGHKERMAGRLDNFYQLGLGVAANRPQSPGFIAAGVGRVALVAVAVAFHNSVSSV